jgi:GTP-binding protein HflX
LDNQTPVERAVLVGAPTKDVSQRLADEHLEELGRLTLTAGGVVSALLRQRIDAPNPQFFIGKGKAQELRDLVESSKADLVVFDDELSPAQGKNLEEMVGVRVMDRPELILDIFATRARTSEAKMQVELAQLEYLLPRLKRMWSHLSRIRGGIGLRGPGETQLETDRRLIGTRITDLKGKLKEVARARAIQRKGREKEFRAALVGYTNAGKSSLLKALSGADLFVEDRLFATLDSATRMVELGSGHRALVTDTVGFIRKLPHHLIASFRSTLEEAREADLLLHVIDASDPDWEEHREVVQEVLEELELRERPQLLVFNKTDRITHQEEEAMRTRVRALEDTPAVFVSALQEESLTKVRDSLKARIRMGLQTIRVSVSPGDGETIAALHRNGEVLNQRSKGPSLEIDVRIPTAFVGRLRAKVGIAIEELD